MKKTNIFATAFAALALLLSFSLVQNCYAGTNTSTNLEFIQTAPKAKLEMIPGKKGEYKITLYNPNPYVSFFSDRPKRMTGMMPIPGFLALWNNKNLANNFATIPPNGALESQSKIMIFKRHRLSLLASLSNPQYDAKNKTMTYTLSSLNSKDPGVKQLDLGFTVLFIDGLDIHWNPGGF